MGATGPQGPQGPQGPAGPTDDDTTKKKPVNRKHPTHDAAQDKRQAARKEARQDKRQGAPTGTVASSQAIPAANVASPFHAAARPTAAAQARKNARIAARRKG
jgi:hypothetical protein